METLTLISEGGPPSQLRRRTADEEFCRSLPRQDPIAAQKLLCAAVSRLLSNREPDDHKLSALLSFDRHAHQISTHLLVRYGEGDAQLRSIDRRVFIAAQRLARSFAQAYELFLGQVENSADKSWRESAGTILIRLFRHRQVELLLRLFRYKKRNSEQWRQVHRAYQFAQAEGSVSDGMPRSLPEDKSAPAQTLDRQFIQILLVGAMNTGQFSPLELLWASNWIGRWGSLLTLQSADANGGAHGERNGFVVDLRGAEGLKRFYAGDALFAPPWRRPCRARRPMKSRRTQEAEHGR